MRIIAKIILKSMLFFINTSLHATTQPFKITQHSIAQNIVFHIAKPGLYKVMENIKFGTIPFIIDSNDVIFDLQGHTIDFSRENAYGISFMAGRTNITIKNGSIRQASESETLSLTQNTEVTLSKLEISTAGTTALLVHSCSDVRIDNLTISGTMLKTGVQIEQSVNVFIDNCTMQNIYAKSFRGFCIQQCQNVVCKNNIVNNVQAVSLFQGFFVKNSSRIFLSKNLITMNTAHICIGITLSGNRHNKIFYNEISMNTTKINQKHLRSETDFNEKLGNSSYSKKSIFKGSNDFKNLEELVLDTANTSQDSSSNANQLPDGTLIGINIGREERFATISNNIIKDNIGSYASWGIRINPYIPSKRDKTRTLHIDKNQIGSNIGAKYQYGLYDADKPCHNTYIQNKILFHGKSLDGSGMPIFPECKANYFMHKNCQITNLIKEAPADNINFFTDDLNNKNLSIY
jgi:hypothetical protein